MNEAILIPPTILPTLEDLRTFIPPPIALVIAILQPRPWSRSGAGLVGAGSNSIIPFEIIPFDQVRLDGIKSVKTIALCSEAWLVYLKMVCRRVKFI